MQGLNTTTATDYQYAYWSATLYEVVNGVVQTQQSPLYRSWDWVGEFNVVLQWSLNGRYLDRAGSLPYTFDLRSSGPVAVKYTYWWYDYYTGWKDPRTGKDWSDSSAVGPIQC